MATAHVFLISIIFILICRLTCELTVVYIGCYEDGGASNRLFKDLKENFPDALTPNKCNEHCRGRGFAYAGTQFSFECFCSKTKPPDDKKSLESECNSKCSGDESLNCGGINRLAVFSTGIPEPLGVGNGDVLRSLGCFKDSSKRILSGYRHNFPGSLTNQKCVKLCTGRGFYFAGTEYGSECHCGNRKPTFKEYANDEECSKRCDGDGNQLCGGNWRISIFETSKSDFPKPTEDGKYIGCFKDQINSRELNGHMEDFGNFLTPLKCTGLCYSKGFLYSGTQFSFQCFCGDKPPNPISKVTEDECFKPCSGNAAEVCGGDSRNSVRETDIPDMPVFNKFLGCFNDQNNQIFKEVKLFFGTTNSPRRCMNFCWQLGFRYSGVEYGQECFCGNDEPRANLVVNPEDCNMPCSGDVEENCGASWRMAVYATNVTAPVIPLVPTTPKTCITSTTVVSGKDSICRGDIIFEDQFNTPLGDKWNHVVMIPDVPPIGLVSVEEARLQQNDQNKIRSKNISDEPLYFAIPETEMTSRNGKKGREEGSQMKEEAVSSMNIDSYKIPHKDKIRIFSEMIASQLRKLNLQSQAVAMNKIKEVLFGLEMEDSTNINQRTNTKTPNQGVFTCSCPSDNITTSTTSYGPQDIDEGEEFEFAIFTSDPKNSFTRKNRLVIKPTLINETFVHSGSLHLESCTGMSGTRQCGYQAASYNILPPVATARIHTRNSFSFRYGIVEIRAKLPIGDWLMPEIWLEPKSHFYGPAYASGRIRIAMTRGNVDFRCNDEDLGSNHMEFGVAMGTKNNVQRRSLITKLPANWHDHFHNYTLTWTPDGISFKVDSEEAKELVPKGRRLCEIIGFENRDCLTWSSGSRIAPFDQDFYISLGLSVGNARDFPDECTNRGKPKPWRNLEQKAMLKFWLDRENWQGTWKDDNSSLYIEHVRVTAL